MQNYKELMNLQNFIKKNQNQICKKETIAWIYRTKRKGIDSFRRLFQTGFRERGSNEGAEEGDEEYGEKCDEYVGEFEMHGVGDGLTVDASVCYLYESVGLLQEAEDGAGYYAGNRSYGGNQHAFPHEYLGDASSRHADRRHGAQ